MRESSGNWSDWDTICSTRGFVTLIDEAYSRLASRDGFLRPKPPKRTGRARIFLSSWLHLRSVIAGMSNKILYSLMALMDPESAAKFLKSTSTDVSSQRCRLRSTLVVDNYHKISQNPLSQYFKKLYNFDNFIRRRLSDHDKITFALKYLPMSRLR